MDWRECARMSQIAYMYDVLNELELRKLYDRQKL